MTTFAVIAGAFAFGYFVVSPWHDRYIKRKGK